MDPTDNAGDVAPDVPAAPGQLASSSSQAAENFQAVLEWLAYAANRERPDGAHLFGELCERLRASGLPLWRAALQLENLHPLYYGYCLHWYAGEPAVEVPRTHEFAEHRKTPAVLRTYLGSGPGQEVLEGRTRRGDVRNLQAAVLLTDLRGFTPELPRQPTLKSSTGERVFRGRSRRGRRLWWRGSEVYRRRRLVSLPD